jgi:hypothetical protein
MKVCSTCHLEYGDDELYCKICHGRLYESENAKSEWIVVFSSSQPFLHQTALACLNASGITVKLLNQSKGLDNKVFNKLLVRGCDFKEAQEILKLNGFI